MESLIFCRREEGGGEVRTGGFGSLVRDRGETAKVEGLGDGRDGRSGYPRVRDVLERSKLGEREEQRRRRRTTSSSI